MPANRSRNQVYCPVCTTGWEIPKPAIPWGRLVIIGFMWGGLIGVTLGLAFSVLLGFWAGLMVWVIYLAAAETWHNLRMKKNIICPVCSYDPLLYKKSPEAAKEKCLQNAKKETRDVIEKWQALQKSKPVTLK